MRYRPKHSLNSGCSPFKKGVATLGGIALAMSLMAAPAREHPYSGLLRDVAGGLRGQDNMSKGTMMAMPLVAPLFIQDRDFASTLVVVNGSAVTAVADVVLSGLDGREITRKTVSLTGHSQLRLEVFQLLQTAVSGVTMGRITVTQNPTQKGSSLLASLSMTYLGSHQPTYIDEELAMPTTEGSQILRAVADQSSGSPLIAITSLSEMPQRITIECLGESETRSFSKSVQLLGGETLMTGACSHRTVYGGDLATAFTEDGEEPREPHSVGVALRTDGMPGSFAAFGLARHRTDSDEYFSALTFADPKMIRSSSTVFTGVLVGSSSLFPKGKYVPQLTMVNFSTNDIHVRLKYAQSSVSTPVVQDLQNMIVPARSSTTLAVNSLKGDPGLRNSFLVIPDGAPGELVAKLVSVSESSLREVELLGKDEMSKENGGSHPWSLEQSTESTLLLFNPSAEEQPFTVAIQAGNVLWQKVYKLASMQTEAIRIRGLIEGRIKDDRGKILPGGALEGEVGWFTPGPGGGKGRILQSNPNLAMARNFSCGNGYVLCGASFSANTTTIPIGQTATFGTLFSEVCFDSIPGPGCTGTFSYYGTSGYTFQWNTGASSIISFPGASNTATVTVYGQGAGSTSVTAYAYDPVGHCGPYLDGATGFVTPTVSISGPSYVPLRTGASTGPNSMTLTSSVNPSGGTYGWTTSSNKVSLSNTSSANVTVTSAAASAASPDVPITLTYTANGQSANATANITVRKPSSLQLISDTPNPTGHTCTGSPTSNTCTQSHFQGSGTYSSYLRTRQYHIMDQFIPPQWIQGYALDIQESYTAPTGQCAGDSVVTTSGAGDTAADCFYFCSATCQTGGSCSVSATQSITVNGYNVGTESVTWTCSDATIQP